MIKKLLTSNILLIFCTYTVTHVQHNAYSIGVQENTKVGLQFTAAKSYLQKISHVFSCSFLRFHLHTGQLQWRVQSATWWHIRPTLH